MTTASVRHPGALRGVMHRHPRLVDLAVAVVVLMWIYVRQNHVGLSAPLMQQLDGPLFVLPVAACAALLVRRRHPSAVFVFIAMTCGLLIELERDVPYLALAVALYSLAVYRSNRAAVAALVIGSSLVVLMSGPAPSDRILLDTYALDILLALAPMIIGTLLGVTVGNNKRYVEALLLHAAERAELAMITERTRIAREMHDVIAHGLSVMIQLSDGAEAAVVADPDRSREASRQTALTGRRSLSDVRRILGLLSATGSASDESESGLQPQPALDQVPALIDSYRAAGLPVTMRQSIDVLPDLGRQLLIYRTVQESLTNALRYAVGATRVDVSIRSSSRGIEVATTDDGEQAAGSSSVGTTRGLTGLADRAAIYGGTLTSGFRDDKGWSTALFVPPETDSR